MATRWAADAVLLLHAAFILFVLFGGLLTLRRRWMPLVHLPAAFWGFFVEMTGRGCPLTALENSLRRHAGQAGYADSFIEHYLLDLLYPAGLTTNLQLLLAAVVVAVNLSIYGWIFLRRRQHR